MENSISLDGVAGGRGPCSVALCTYRTAPVGSQAQARHGDEAYRVHEPMLSLPVCLLVRTFKSHNKHISQV